MRRMRKDCVSGGWRVCVAFGALWLGVPALLAQDTGVPRNQDATSASDPSTDPAPLPTMVPHLETDRWWLSGQANFISQWASAAAASAGTGSSIGPGWFSFQMEFRATIRNT